MVLEKAYSYDDRKGRKKGTSVELQPIFCSQSDLLKDAYLFSDGIWQLPLYVFLQVLSFLE